MAQESETERNASGIARTAKRKWGYDAQQVDAFLERAHMLYEGEGAQLTQHDIQNVSFDLVKGGYVIAQVDAALARLERAVVDKRTTWEISQHGRVAWKGQTEDLFKKLDAHAEREQGERFKPGEGKNPSYDRKQVDRVIDKCLTKAAGELGIEKVSEEDAKAIADTNSQSVANVVFTQRKGKKGYDERQVDYYLAACVQLLTRLESYARVADFVGEPSEETTSVASPDAASSSAAQETQMITPLFAAPAAPAPTAPAAPVVPPATPSGADSFDALNKAEHEIFTSAVTSPVSTPAAKSDAPAVPPVVPPVFQPQASAPVSEPSSIEETQAFDPLGDDAPQSFVPRTPAPSVPAEPETPVVHNVAPAAPVVPPSSAGSEPEQDSSLAALAHLAHTVNTPNATEDTFTPRVPSLSTSDLPSVAADAVRPASVPAAPSFTPEPEAPAAAPKQETVAAESAPVPETAATPAPERQQEQEDKKPEPSPTIKSIFPSSGNDANLDIPDLSFPSFD